MTTKLYVGTRKSNIWNVSLHDVTICFRCCSLISNILRYDVLKIKYTVMVELPHHMALSLENYQRIKTLIQGEVGGVRTSMPCLSRYMLTVVDDHACSQSA